MFKYKHIQAAHEVRMWIMTIATGIAAANMMLERHPDTKVKIQNAIERAKKKLNKNENPDNVIKVVIIKNEREP